MTVAPMHSRDQVWRLRRFAHDVQRNFAAVNPWNVLWMAINVASSISIVFVNKWVYTTYNFNYPTTLTLIHFLVTFLGLQACAMLGVFTVKKLRLAQVLPLAISFSGFVVLTNISLRYNSVGFYQIAKVMTTPVIMVIQFLWYSTSSDTKTRLSLLPICLGVSIATVTDFQLNLKGTMYAAVAVVVTSFYQIWVGTKQKELQVSSMQLLYYQAPLAAGILLIVIPLFDDVGFGDKSLPHWYRTAASWDAFVIILLSGFIAFAVNLSIFLVIGKTSPVTYNVLGHFKLTMIIFGGFVFFGAPLDSRNLLGICLTLSGVFYYTHIKLEQQRKDQEAKAGEQKLNS
eukprot:tig00000037_g10109.t1